MTTINRLSAVDKLQASDLLVIYDSSNSDARKASLNVLVDFLTEALASDDINAFDTQRAVPSATAFDIQITDSSANTHLILTPTATFADGTITLPDVTKCIDKQLIMFNCTQIITTFSINLNGATAVTGSPSTIAANGFFTLKLDLQTKTWYRVG